MEVLAKLLFTLLHVTTIENTYKITLYNQPGLWPHSTVQQLRMFSVFKLLFPIEAEKIISAVKQLAIETSLSGICHDEDMAAVLNLFSVYSSVVVSNHTCLNRQRALWLNKEGAIAIR